MKMQQLMAILHENGYKITPQRMTVCEIILSSKSHPTAEQIYEEVKREHPTISLATVYQTLHLLTKLGVIQELGFSDKVTRYEPNVSPHINVICQKCGEIYDYEAKSVKEMWTKIIGELKFKTIGQRLDIYRYCDRCKR